MNILVLGGTQFVGRHFVQAAIDNGHHVTLFHRGKSSRGLFPDAEHVIGDRFNDLGLLKGRKFDAVYDSSAYFPRAVRTAHEALHDATDQYLFISTISVYADFSKLGLKEDTLRVDFAPTDEETIDAVTYGGLKVLCEDWVNENWGGRSWIVRPGIVAGPNDHTNRFTYWVKKLAEGKPFLAPQRLVQPMQVVDGHDLGVFCVRGLEKGQRQTVHCVGPGEPCTMAQLFEKGGQDFGWSGQPVPMKEPVEGVHLPMDLGPTDENDGHRSVDCSLAKSMGFVHRPITTTMQEVWDEFKSRSDHKTQYDLDPDLELDLVQKAEL